MTEKGHWCGMVKMKSKETTEIMSLLYCIHCLKQWNKRPIVQWTLWPWKCRCGSQEVSVVDRALGTGEPVITDANVNCWANPERTCYTGDRKCHWCSQCCQYYSQCCEWNCCCCPAWGTCLPRIPIYQGLLTQELKTNIADDISTSSQTDVMQRRNIHSLLTLAAEPSKPQCKCSCTTARLASSVRVDGAGKTWS